MTKTVFILAVASLAFAPITTASRIHINVLPYSQQYGPSTAAAGAGIVVDRQGQGRAGQAAHATGSTAVHSRGSSGSHVVGGATTTQPAYVYPTLPASSPSLQQTNPRGPGTFWYLDGSGHLCVYIPNASALCYTITAAGAASAAVTPITPGDIAARAAERFTLTPGQVHVSPSNAGLTGTPSWFWLDPAPTTQQGSISLGGEDVTVTATPQVDWQFGDGTATGGGAGAPYQPGAVPAAAILHTYATRCLPGDQGHDPYVLASCGGQGYQLTATVSWQISYQAAGPVAQSGTLPTRTTSSTATYPVSEVRAFLVGGAG